MTSYTEIVESMRELETQLQGGPRGAREACLASALLTYATLHHELVAFARTLRGTYDDVGVHEDAGHFSLRVDGVTVRIQRLSRQSVIVFEFWGFDTSLVPPSGDRLQIDVPDLSAEDCVARGKGFGERIAKMLRDEYALRGGRW